ADDALYYTAPRFVHHLDAVARREVTEIYAAHLRNGTAILDLMSSWNSHLPDSLEGCTVVGLGLNREEMEHNSRLSEIVIHDLNRNKRLPFKENTFDTVICTASIEYLTHPLEVINEVARVLRPQGKFITTFSDRWFPGKEISLWSELHEFERLGLVLDMYRQTGCFSQLETKSVRGLPRPANDPHISTRLLSDPVFSICGVRAPSSPVSGRSRLTV
ncbi:MAG: SAM-dependent methyltransferase, partial [Desulfobulbus propionicus]